MSGPGAVGRPEAVGPSGTHRPASARRAGFERWRARLRLWSGCVLFLYVLLHLANHALGLVSLDAMEMGRDWFLAIWRNPLGTAALYASFVVHPLNALWSIDRRRTRRMPAWEAAQILLGLSIPPLLAGHLAGTRLAHERYGQVDSYHRVVRSFWALRPAIGARQSTALVVARLHGCVGLPARHEITVRNRLEPLAVRVIADVRNPRRPAPTSVGRPCTRSRAGCRRGRSARSRSGCSPAGSRRSTPGARC